MIRVIAGGKKNSAWYKEAIDDYEKRLNRQYKLEWQFMEEEKMMKYLADWPFSSRQYVICCDERGDIISSDRYSVLLNNAFANGKEIIILIGGAYGFTPEIRERVDFVWSFSKLVFPHAIARLLVVEQTYRAMQIAINGPYHHA